MTNEVTFRLRHNLSALLKDRRITASELSRKTGVAKQVLSDWMSGVQPRKIEHLYMVARELGVTMDGLCFAQSDDEILAAKRTTSLGGGGTFEDFPASGVVISPDEIRGRFEIHLRRI